MSVLDVVHLLDDMALGGITKSLGMFELPAVAEVARSRVEARPLRGLAPRLDADVIVNHVPPAWGALPFLLSLRLRNPGAVIVHAEHSYTRAWEALKVPSPRRFGLLLRIAMRLSDHVTAVSAGQGAWLAERAGLPLERVRVIRPWSPNPGLEELAPPAPSPDRPLVLGCYGRFCEQKGMDTLVEAIKLLPATRFHLLLGGFGEDEASLRAAAGDAPHIEFVGRIDRVAGFLDRCDAVVIPSRWEAFGQVGAEARRAARPILVADVDGLPEQVGEAGIVADCATPSSLADAIATLPGLPLVAMGEAGRRAVSDGEAAWVRGWSGLFREIAATRRSPLPPAPGRTPASRNRPAAAPAR